jgi:hypothetical protein
MKYKCLDLWEGLTCKLLEPQTNDRNVKIVSNLTAARQVSVDKRRIGRKADFRIFPVAVRPKSGPEGRFPARKHYCVT